MSFERHAANAFQRYVHGALNFSIKRGGLLYGSVGEGGHVRVDAIYEPPQVPSLTTVHALRPLSGCAFHWAGDVPNCETLPFQWSCPHLLYTLHEAFYKKHLWHMGLGLSALSPPALGSSISAAACENDVRLRRRAAQIACSWSVVRRRSSAPTSSPSAWGAAPAALSWTVPVLGSNRNAWLLPGSLLYASSLRC